MYAQCISNAIKIKCTVSDTLPAFTCSHTNFPEAVIASSFNTQVGLCFGVELYVTKGGKSIQNEAGITSKEAIVLHIIRLSAALKNCMFFSKSATEIHCAIEEKITQNWMPGNCMPLYAENSEPRPPKYLCTGKKNGLNWLILKNISDYLNQPILMDNIGFSFFFICHFQKDDAIPNTWMTRITSLVYKVYQYNSASPYFLWAIHA